MSKNSKKIKLFKEFKQGGVFIETGSGEGDGIDAALKAGYQTIYSFEKSNSLSEQVKSRFPRNSDRAESIIIFNKDSRSKEGLEFLLDSMYTPCTFWLDSHFSKGNTVGQNDNPILEELEIISKHRIKNHIILIDDVRYFGTDYFKTKQSDTVSLLDLRVALFIINPKYFVDYRDSDIAHNDVMVAFL